MKQICPKKAKLEPIKKDEKEKCLARVKESHMN